MHALAAENKVYVRWKLAFAILLHEEEITLVVQFWSSRSSDVAWRPHASKTTQLVVIECPGLFGGRVESVLEV
jgi:hypothetical protein